MPPASRATALDPIQFKDFSTGIADNPGVNYPAESATSANTYRCIANRAGALIPLPVRTEPFKMPHVAATPTTQIGVNGIYVPPMGLLPTTGPFNPDNYPEHELMVGVEWVDGTAHHHNLYRVRRFDDPGIAFDTVTTRTHTDPAGAVFKPGGMFFGTTRSNRAAPTTVGPPVVIAAWGSGTTDSYVLSFPDDQAPSSATPYMIFNNTRFFLNAICHQGRVILESATAYGQGANTTTFMGENLEWSRVNNVGDWTPNTDPAVAIHAFPQAFVEENPSGYAVMASMSANELFCVKGGGGGLYVSGDLDNPTVVSLPMVTGSDLSAHVVSELGVIYLNRDSGVWVWPHGDTTQLLSGKMDPAFWTVGPPHDLDTFGAGGYSMSRCDDWILVPNNYLFDTQLKSWWRLEDPAIARYRFTASRWHYIYAAESFYTGNSDDARSAVHFYKRENKSPTFSWQSHPIWQSVADVVNVSAAELIVEGQGTVTATLTALNGDTRSLTVQLANPGFPERFREAFAIQGKYLQLRIQADSLNPFLPAPTVYSVSLYPFTEAPIGHTL